MANDDKKKQQKDAVLEKLQLEALDLAEKLGVKVDVENIEAMGAQQLTELVESYKAKLANPPPPGPPAPLAAAPSATVVAAGDRYFVAKGVSLTTKRGVLGEDEEVTALDVSGGREQLEYLATQHEHVQSDGSKKLKGPYLVKR